MATIAFDGHTHTHTHTLRLSCVRFDVHVYKSILYFISGDNEEFDDVAGQPRRKSATPPIGKLRTRRCVLVDLLFSLEPFSTY